jgi:hypothetical protein
VRLSIAPVARCLLLVALLAGAEGCGGKSSKSTTTTTGAKAGAAIVVDRSIGRVSLGLPQQRVVAMLGQPASTLHIFSTSLEPGTLARYESHGADLLIVYDSSGHVASIETYSPYYATGNGIGPGASLTRASLQPEFRRDSCDLGFWNATRGTGRLAPVTVFTPNGGAVASVLITELRFDTNCAQAGRGLEPRPNVVVDHSIGGVALGAAEAAVEKIIGSPLARRALALGGGAAGTLARYAVDGAPFLVAYDPGKRAVSITAYSTYFFTPAGLGPGSPRAFVTAVRRFAHPCNTGFWDGTAGAAPAHAVTLFTIAKGSVAAVVITKRQFAHCT